MKSLRELTHLDLFSGIGGFSLAAGWAGFRTVAFVEKDAYCQKVLAKHWPDVVCHSDIKQFDGHPYQKVDLLTGGFPCQPFSQAGKRRGKEDDRYLWPEMLRVIQESKPTWVLGENVAGLDGLGLDDCISDLEASGYEVAPPLEIPACAVDARHIRNRIWILAHANGFCGGTSGSGGIKGWAANATISAGEQCAVLANNEYARLEIGRRTGNVSAKADTRGVGPNNASSVREQERENLANADKSGSQRRISEELRECGTERAIGASGAYWLNREWPTEPTVGRVAHGIPRRVDRLKGLGNAIVPQVAFVIIKSIREEIMKGQLDEENA